MTWEQTKMPTARAMPTKLQIDFRMRKKSDKSIYTPKVLRRNSFSTYR